MSEELPKSKNMVPTWLVCLLGFIFGVLALGLSMPVLLSSHKKGDHAIAIQSAKQWGYALFNFENDFGTYPNEDTAKELRDKYPDQAHLLKTKSSNDFLRQLVVAGYIDDQYAEMLDSEEFLFAYVVGINSTVNSAMPLLICPLEKGQYSIHEKYSRKHYNKRTVVLHVDMSVSDPRSSDGFFDWSRYDFGDLEPKIAWPESEKLAIRERGSRLWMWSALAIVVILLTLTMRRLFKAKRGGVAASILHLT